MLSCIDHSYPASETNLNAMRLGPGKHLKGRVLMGGIVKPEEFDYFHEVCICKLEAALGECPTTFVVYS